MITSFSGEYRWLSNFEPCVIMFEGEEYKSVEHAYVASKTLELSERKHIQQLEHAGQAKRYGKTITLRSDWEVVKITFMQFLLQQKFNQAPFKNLLTETGQVEIIEGNRWGDKFWGAVLDVNGQFQGQNNLGVLIMSLRNGFIWE